MQPAQPQPRARILVCCNPATRPDLENGCGAASGPRVAEALREQVAKRGLAREVWITRTFCLGICPDRGCTVELSPNGGLFREVEPEHACALVDQAIVVASKEPMPDFRVSRPPAPAGDGEVATRPSANDGHGVLTLLESLAPAQEARVLGLARRLRPDITADDVKNPHDFPELNDQDFQFEDGKLAGLWTAIYAVRAELRRRSDAP